MKHFKHMQAASAKEAAQRTPKPERLRSLRAAPTFWAR